MANLFYPFRVVEAAKQAGLDLEKVVPQETLDRVRRTAQEAGLTPEEAVVRLLAGIDAAARPGTAEATISAWRDGGQVSASKTEVRTALEELGHDV
jgi:hypothetical protein